MCALKQTGLIGCQLRLLMMYPFALHMSASGLDERCPGSNIQTIGGDSCGGSNDDAAMALVPDLLVLLINFGVLAVIRCKCAAAASSRFKRSVDVVRKMQAAMRANGQEWRVNGGGIRGLVKLLRKQYQAADAAEEASAFATPAAAAAASTADLMTTGTAGLQPIRSHWSESSDALPAGPVTESVEPSQVALLERSVDVTPPSQVTLRERWVDVTSPVSASPSGAAVLAIASKTYPDSDTDIDLETHGLVPHQLPPVPKTSQRALATWRAVGSLAAATAGVGTPDILPATSSTRKLNPLCMREMISYDVAGFIYYSPRHPQCVNHSFIETNGIQ